MAYRLLIYKKMEPSLGFGVANNTNEAPCRQCSVTINGACLLADVHPITTTRLVPNYIFNLSIL